MQTQWDYTTLAQAYLKRPQYADEAIDAMVRTMGLRAGDPVCDVGAGVGHLTVQLAKRGLRVVAVEPNDAMRRLGQEQTRHLPEVHWREGTGEASGQPGNAFKAVTFGSSFNVTDRPRALQESHRLLQAGGWFACLWNHRDLEDPVQAAIEAIIRGLVPGYAYGTRRQDQTEVIQQSGLFTEVLQLAGGVRHAMDIGDVVEAWRSHATLQRQAQDSFGAVIDAIQAYLYGLQVPALMVPYTTRLWMARRVD